MSHKEEQLAAVAKEVFGVESLETKNRDSEDFHEVAVWDLKQALEKAFQLGVEEMLMAVTKAQLR